MPWTLSWRFDREYLLAGSSATLNISLMNRGNSRLFISHVDLIFSFKSYRLYLNALIESEEIKTLRTDTFNIPSGISGQYYYNIYAKVSNIAHVSWRDNSGSSVDHPINVFSTPPFRIFLSRGIQQQDLALNESIAQLIRQWGFTTRTVGIDVIVPNHLVLPAIEDEIQNAVGVITVITQRYRTDKGLSKTFEWAHAELMAGRIKNKPLVIIRDKEVPRAGLVKYLVEYHQVPEIIFDPKNITLITKSLNFTMPIFRRVIEDKNWNKFVGDVGNLLTIVLAGVGLGAIGYYFLGNFSNDR